MRPIYLLGLTCALLASAGSSLPANPTGGNVAAGSATIAGQGTGAVTINQFSNTAVINWQSFSIGSGESTSFLQPSAASAVLNRVLGGQTSIINGSLTANGQVYLINGNGIVVGPGGIVTANGFTASTRDISDADFLSGNLHFTGGNGNGVQNLGAISALGGDVYLIGKTVDNMGSIKAPNGTVGLASGDDVVLNLGGQEHVFVSPVPTATSAAGQTAVHNGGSIASASAELKAANGNMFALAINNEGTIRATTVTQSGGRIFLTADSGPVQNTGTISATSGSNGGQISVATSGSVWNGGTIDASNTQNGGTVSVTAKNFENDGTIGANGTKGAGGSVGVTFSGNALATTSGVINAKGATHGGSVLLNGTGANSEAYLSLRIDTAGSSAGGGPGGEIQIDAPTLYLTGATLVASGARQGGSIYLGQGDPSSTLPLAQNVYVTKGTSIQASSKAAGHGGLISVNSSGSTEFLGSADASSAGTGGVGGLIEISGQGKTYFGGTANASAPGGKAGTFKLDPKYIIVAANSGAADFEFVDPDPGSNNNFGNPNNNGVINLPTNFTVITSPGDSFSASNNGAVYLFNDINGALISTLRGSNANDDVGSSVVTFNNGNFVVISSEWNSERGAISFGNGTTGFLNGGGAVSSTNSLVGTTSGDILGDEGTATIGSAGNLLVFSPDWGSEKGALTFISSAGTGTLTGAVGSSNSLVGANDGDDVGSNGSGNLISLSTGNDLLKTPNWSFGASAITFIKSSSATTGVVGSANSIVGSTDNDRIGSGGIDDLRNGHYLVFSPFWNDSLGAVTMGSSTAVTAGLVGSSNSLVGSHDDDEVGSGGYMALLNGSNATEGYLIESPNFDDEAGALTWLSGTTLSTGVVSASNSLVGGTPGDNIGSGGIVRLSTGSSANHSGNYLIESPLWTNPNGNGNGGDDDFIILPAAAAPSGSSTTDAGAVTYFKAATGTVGSVSATNSIVGVNSGDFVGGGGGSNLTYLTNGNIVLQTLDWNFGTGAVTLLQGSSPTVGVVGAATSLVGTFPGDDIGNGGIFNLKNGNYVVSSPAWGDNGGAVTFVNGTSGLDAVVSASNSLVGTENSSDRVGSGITVLSDNNYVVNSPSWNGSVGAVTWGSGTSGVKGSVTSSNSLVGTNSDDSIGSGGVTDLKDGSYVVVSPEWNDSTGAVTVGSSTGGLDGPVTTDNSLTGANFGDSIGSGGILVLTHQAAGNFLVLSPSWGNGDGAVTLGAAAGATVTSGNSLVGSSTNDHVGSTGVVDLGTGHYLVTTTAWNDNTGAVTLGNGLSGTSGVIGSGNSLIGASTGDQIGSGGYLTLDDGNLLIQSPLFESGKGAVTWINGTNGDVSGQVSPGATVSSTNSLIGSSTGDHVGNNGFTDLDNGNYLIVTPTYGGGAGAVTWGDESVGVAGVVGSGISLVGSSSGDNIGSDIDTSDLGDGNYLVISSTWNNGTGAVTWGDENAGIAGVVGGGNSLVGSGTGDHIGSNVQFLDDGNYLVISSTWAGGAGAVTWGDQSVGVKGPVGSGNSLVGSSPNDAIGNDVEYLDNGNYLVVAPNWGSGTGAVTWVDQGVGVAGVVGSGNSLVGSNDNDHVGNGGIQYLNDGNYLVVSADALNGMGAVTWADESIGVKGVVGSGNSLVGASTGDHVGSGMLINLSGDQYLIQSPQFNNGAGAVTWFSDESGVIGTVDSTVNSLVGQSSGDGVGTGCNDTYTLENGNFLLLTPTWGGGVGAVTFMAGGSATIGVVTSDNSLVGSTSNDSSNTSIHELDNGDFDNYLVVSPSWNNDTGAVTWGSGTSGVSGVVSASNSIVGATNGDQVGSGGNNADGIIDLPNGDYLVNSPSFNNNAGAFTWGDSANGTSGTVNFANSIIGGTADDNSEYSGYSADQSIYLVSFTTDSTRNDSLPPGDGRVLAGLMTGPSSTAASDPNSLSYSYLPGETVTISAQAITAVTDTGTNVLMQANSDITVNQDIITVPSSSSCALVPAVVTTDGGSSWVGTGGSIELDAGRSIILNGNITTANGDLTLLANDINNANLNYRDSGNGSIVQADTTTLDVGTGTFTAVVTAGSGIEETIIHKNTPSGPSTSTAGDIVLNNVNAGTAIINAIDPQSDVVLEGQINATNTTLAAGRAFLNTNGATAITGQWDVYSKTPADDTFGGLISNNFATFGVCPPQPPIGGPEANLVTPNTIAESSGDGYFFSVRPVLSVRAVDQTKTVGDTIDFTNPQYGRDYVVTGFFNGAAYGGVFNDTIANTFCGSPSLTSTGAPSDAPPGSYPIVIMRNTFKLARTESGYILPCNNFFNGTLTVESLNDGSFDTSGFNHLLPFPLYWVFDPDTLDFSPIGVDSDGTGAINDGDGAYILLGSSTQFTQGPDRLVVPGNGIWRIFGGNVYHLTPPPAVLNQLQLNLSPSVYAHLHGLLFGTP